MPLHGARLPLVVLGRPQFSWTRIKGESDVTRRWGYGSVEGGEGSWVGGDGGSPEGDRSRRRRGGDGVGGLGAGTTVEREPETGCGVAARGRTTREGSRASGRLWKIGRGARAGAAPRAPATRGHGGDTARPTRAARGRHRPGEGTATNRARRTGRKQGRATISAGPRRSSWAPSAPTRSRIAPWRATRRRHGGSAPRPPPANRARTASPGRRASRAIAAQANTRTATSKRTRAKGGALPKERAGRRGGSEPDGQG